jgi:hypothetical protein
LYVCFYINTDENNVKMMTLSSTLSGINDVSLFNDWEIYLTSIFRDTSDISLSNDQKICLTNTWEVLVVLAYLTHEKFVWLVSERY